MLKIKDNVDLKELEKFGFLKADDIYECDCGDNASYIIVFEKEYIDEDYDWASNSQREIGLTTGLYGDLPETYFNSQLDVLFDLIQAGLVERTDEH